MKLLHQLFEIEQVADDGAAIRLLPECVIYQAHFPGQPITPGVCIVQIITELLGQRLGRALQLRCINNIKFLQPISPLQTPRLEVKFSTLAAPAEPPFSTKGTLSADGTVYTKFSMTYE